MNPIVALLRPSTSLLILLVILVQTASETCSPSACGIISNISFPFRLKQDPTHCGDPNYELQCENNLSTILYLNSQRYQVKAINYQNLTIRLEDDSIFDSDSNSSSCSLPKHSLYRYNFTNGYPYDVTKLDPRRDLYSVVDIAWPVNIISCPNPLSNSSLMPADCADESSTGRTHTYVKLGRMKAADLPYMCRVDVIVLTSWNYTNGSVSAIHDALLYGFELSWARYNCSPCPGDDGGYFTCPIKNGDSVSCSTRQSLLDKLRQLWGLIKNFAAIQGYNGPFAAIVLILLLFLVVLFAGVSIPAKIIIGFICVWGFYKVGMNSNYFNTYWHVSHLRLIIGLFFLVRLVIVFPWTMRILIYKFQTRHLSKFDTIEDFLKGDNKLMPIRYSFSELKKITGDFREKLGQGGYGSVYKGKLRSGHYVAVKLLGKPEGNDQDFMNEIATIGRIHHVNIVQLVGYCAERSKRALVFDFMPNGSLEKHINSLRWDQKYDIAIGVARGIEYLHRGCDIQILHFDIKPHNILLDDKFVPKISDFGLAKFCSTQKDTVTLTAARGTIGYVAPELLNRGFGRVSYKADVYSFGMMLMDLVGLNRDMVQEIGQSSQYFPHWIYDRLEQGKNIQIETCFDDEDSTKETIGKKMTIVALHCIQMNPSDRPSMNKVLEMLEGRVEPLQIPNRPSDLLQMRADDMDQSWDTHTDSTSLLCNDADPSVKINVIDV